MKSFFYVLIVLVFFGCNQESIEPSVNGNSSQNGTLKITFEGKNNLIFHGELRAQYSGKTNKYVIPPANYSKIERSEFPVQGNQTIKLNAAILNGSDSPITSGEYILRVEFDGALLKEQVVYVHRRMKFPFIFP